MNSCTHPVHPSGGGPPKKELVRDAVKFFPKKISVGLDLLNEKVAIKGWTETVDNKSADFYFKKFSDLR